VPKSQVYEPMAFPSGPVIVSVTLASCNSSLPVFFTTIEWVTIFPAAIEALGESLRVRCRLELISLSEDELVDVSLPPGSTGGAGWANTTFPCHEPITLTRPNSQLLPVMLVFTKLKMSAWALASPVVMLALRAPSIELFPVFASAVALLVTLAVLVLCTVSEVSDAKVFCASALWVKSYEYILS